MRKLMMTMVVAGALVAALGLAGCGGQAEEPAGGQEPAQDQAAQPEATADQTRDQAAPPAEPAPEATQPAGEQAIITEDEAKMIALTDAGVSEQEAMSLFIHLDSDDGVTKYEVDFETSTDEYEYDIDPQTGEILKAEKETRDD